MNIIFMFTFLLFVLLVLIVITSSMRKLCSLSLAFMTTFYKFKIVTSWLQFLRTVEIIIPYVGSFCSLTWIQFDCIVHTSYHISIDYVIGSNPTIINYLKAISIYGQFYWIKSNDRMQFVHYKSHFRVKLEDIVL